MNRLITFEPHHPETFEPAEGFLNLYLDKDIAAHNSLERAQAAHGDGTRGITVRIARDVNGDFTVEKVEEFGV